MQEQNTSRLIYFIGVLLAVGGVLYGITSHWEEIKQVIDTVFANRDLKL